MDEDDDDVFRKGRQRWPSSHHQIKTADGGLHSSGLPSASSNNMLPCRIREEHRRLLYGNPGLLLLAPTVRSQPLDVALQENLQVMDPPPPRPAQSIETLIGQKLRLIGDQFYQEHMTLLRKMTDRHFREVRGLLS
ncbi:BCL2 modifying factor 1 isoform X2 [Misgurnus anguillicaudatus]|uniref:BCL2 modifying factor 1 isoform X2 n=1 Tax=Misgurnus anguillicaudatus TaxID=75329 RepID=UPI00243592CD|nr:BCL2 modifying factor 1 isoform X2 [Misgurnus anguillicaudatus]